MLPNPDIEIRTYHRVLYRLLQKHSQLEREEFCLLIQFSESLDIQLGNRLKTVRPQHLLHSGSITFSSGSEKSSADETSSSKNAVSITAKTFMVD
jgi:hypothetical protein